MRSLLKEENSTAQLHAKDLSPFVLMLSVILWFTASDYPFGILKIL